MSAAGSSTGAVHVAPSSFENETNEFALATNPCLGEYALDLATGCVDRDAADRGGLIEGVAGGEERGEIGFRESQFVEGHQKFAHAEVLILGIRNKDRGPGIPGKSDQRGRV